MRTYWAAHALAKRGHEVHVVTNAKEAGPPYRMHMRAQDWERCEATYGNGSVTVHWTDPVDRSQAYIPMASPFVSKLAAIAARAHSERPFDVIYSHYLEPYGVAGHLAAQIAGVPHVARMAGSDAGRLWHHPQFEALYDHILRSAAVVIASGKVGERAVQRGVDPRRVVFGGGIVVPDDVFTPDGPKVDLVALRSEVEADHGLRELLWGDFAGDKPYFVICGKLGEYKGSFALLAALHRLKRAGLDVGLVALAHGSSTVERNFRARARKLGLVDRVLQIPFLPHWRVPEVLRGCVAACCLEQDFPIVFHSPIIPREVLLCGACLVGSTEVIRKLPGYERLVHGYGCVAVEDVNDVEALAERLAAIVQDPSRAAVVGARGRSFARELQSEIPFAQALERILEAASSRPGLPSAAGESGEDAATRARNEPFFLTRLAEGAIEATARSRDPGEGAAASPMIDLARARDILAEIKRRIGKGETGLEPFVPAIEIEIAIAVAENEAVSIAAADCDPLFRLHMQRWAMAADDLGELRVLRDPRIRVLDFDYDVSDFMQVRAAADLPASPTPRRSHIVAFAGSSSDPRSPLVVDGTTAQILKLSDGTRTAAELVGALKPGISADAHNLKWIESLFVRALISLHERPVRLSAQHVPDGVGCPPHARPSPAARPRRRARIDGRPRQ